ncbi:hypothetical protein Clacol_010388 [Clathrus columnatus]|uniref:Uncharacterized protein n=1 Tax=Clathrus columnatus TaxID=1419009 RepID=A0AAV5ANC6_9AGAM|nr:hypothetical protein Clacol_010388 [Clathrus columnatus]
MATEVLFLDLIREPTAEELETCFDDVIPLPRGFRNAVFGKSINNPQTVVGFLTWNKVESQYNFRNSKLFPKFVTRLARFGICPFHTFYVYFEQGLPHTVLRSPVILELIMVKQRQDILPNQVNHAFNEYARIASEHGLRSYYYGHKYQDPTFFVMLLDWESREGSAISSLALDRLMKEITMVDTKVVRHIVAP